MNFEVGDMIVCAYDYGIVTGIETSRVTINWYEKGSNGEPSTSKHLTDDLENAVDGKHNKLVKGK